MFVCYIFFGEELADLLHNLQASEQVTCQVWLAWLQQTGQEAI